MNKDGHMRVLYCSVSFLPHSLSPGETLPSMIHPETHTHTRMRKIYQNSVKTRLFPTQMSISRTMAVSYRTTLEILQYWTQTPGATHSRSRTGCFLGIQPLWGHPQAKHVGSTLTFIEQWSHGLDEIYTLHNTYRFYTGQYPMAFSLIILYYQTWQPLSIFVYT